MSDLDGRVALVTGGSRGIGAASAVELARMGARVALSYREDKSGAEAVAGQIAALGREAHTVRADVAQKEDVEALFRSVEAALGPVEVLVANAGVVRDKVLAMMKEEDWDHVISINLDGVYRTVKRALRPMMRARWGRIIVISSVAGLHGTPGQANYAAAKAGVIGFSRVVAKEVGRQGITVNVVAPGFVKTSMLEEMSEGMLAAAAAYAPLGRLGEPEEVAAAVGFLASPGAAYVTGSVLVVDGGLSS